MADQVEPGVELSFKSLIARKILIVAGEESGDIYGGRICGHLSRALGGVTIEGVGGRRMRAAGVNTLYDVSQMASVGLGAAIKTLGFFRRALADLKARIATGEYDAVILIDFPDFNLRVAKAADEAGTPVFYYVCPQFWAWRRYRIRTVRKRVDMMLVAFPFEEEFYVKRGINARFTGHPILDELKPVGLAEKEALRERFGAGSRKTLLGLMPGSRRAEVERMLPVMLSAVKIIRANKPVKVVVACAGSVDEALVRSIVEQSGEEAVIAREESWGILNACDFLICKSGTSTLEAAIATTPMVIVYKADSLSYLLAKSLTHVKWAGLPNLLAGREIVPELIQGKMTPANIAKAALPYLTDPARRNDMKSELQKVAAGLGSPGGSARSAKLMVDYLKRFKGA